MPDRRSLVFVLVVLGLAVVFLWLAMPWGEGSGTLALYPLVVFSPVATAFVLASVEGKRGFPRLVRTFRLDRARPRWALAALLVFPALSLVSLGLGWLALGVRPRFVAPEEPWLTIVAACVVFFLVPGFAEEPGWRGFLQERLTGRMGLLSASLVVGVTWGLWHASDLAMHADVYDLRGYLPKLAWIVGASLVLGWLFHRDDSTIVAMVGHFGGSATFAFTPIAPWRGADAGVFWLHVALVWAIGLLLILRFPNAGRSAPEAEEGMIAG